MTLPMVVLSSGHGRPGPKRPQVIGSLRAATATGVPCVVGRPDSLSADIRGLSRGLADSVATPWEHVMSSTTWGVLGAARIAREKVIPAIGRAEAGEVVAVSSASGRA